MSESGSDSQERMLRRLEAEATKYRLRAAKEKERADAAEGKLAEHAKSGEDFAKKIEAAEKKAKDAEQALADAPNKHKAENEKLKADILTRDRKEAFRKAAKGKVREDALDDAFGHLPWEDGDIDETKLGEAVDGLISQKAYLKASNDAAPESGGPGQSAQGGNPLQSATSARQVPKAGRGGAPTSAGDALNALRSQYPNGRIA